MPVLAAGDKVVATARTFVLRRRWNEPVRGRASKEEYSETEKQARRLACRRAAFRRNRLEHHEEWF
jgi:hypothetical protein